MIEKKGKHAARGEFQNGKSTCGTRPHPPNCRTFQEAQQQKRACLDTLECFYQIGKENTRREVSSRMGRVRAARGRIRQIVEHFKKRNSRKELASTRWNVSIRSERKTRGAR